MYVAPKNDRIRQGDLFSNVEFKDAYNSANDVVHDFCVVISQDCDLEQDVAAKIKYQKSKEAGYVQKPNTTPPNMDKYLNTILVCPAFLADNLHKGIHLSSIDWTMQNITSSTAWGDIKNNNSPRYRFLKANKKFGVPDLIMDFKRVYALPRDFMVSIQDQKKAKLEDLFAQAATDHFSSYLSRVALPVLDDYGEIKRE